jgi:hypothetical protein
MKTLQLKKILKLKKSLKVNNEARVRHSEGAQRATVAISGGLHVRISWDHHGIVRRWLRAPAAALPVRDAGPLADVAGLPFASPVTAERECLGSGSA